jgi:branched-chain amino acid transport system ATP-binding protein
VARLWVIRDVVGAHPLQKLLILDEPSQGLAPLIVQEVFRVVTAASREGIAILLVKQNGRAAT